MARIEDRYLGDGVYASDNGPGVSGITLDLRGQDNTTRIVLEPEALAALDRFRADIIASENDGEPPCPRPNP
jgi:hypothetical protein